MRARTDIDEVNALATGKMASQVQSPWSTVPDAALALSRGEFVVVVDDEGREDEGDLVLAAQCVLVY